MAKNKEKLNAKHGQKNNLEREIKKISGPVIGALIVILVACGCASSPQVHRSAYFPDSNTLQANVKTALWHDPTVAPFDLGVDVSRSTVHLTGSVDTLEQKRRAGEVALAVAGVTAVDNGLLVRTGVGAPELSNLGRPGEEPSVLLGRIISTPDVYYGKTLDLQGTVDTVLSPNAFTMCSTGTRENPVLVVARAKDIRNITPGDIVRIRGELEPFNRAAAGQRLNADLEPRKFDTWSNRAAVLADSVMRQYSPNSANR